MTLSDPHNLDRNIVFEFFWRFSAFECALKREAFLKSGPEGRPAEPDWHRFSIEISGRLAELSDPVFRQSIETLKSYEPRQQIVIDGSLEWDFVRQRPNESEETFVVWLLKTTRNNLFHGGKYPDGPVAEVARDREILTAALSVLNGCWELHTGLSKWAAEHEFGV